MGLDMYLMRADRYKDVTPKQVDAVEGYSSWKTDKSDEYTLEQWCGIKESELPAQDVLDFYGGKKKTTYSGWDEKHQFPRTRIMEEVGYWRKANAVHQWFVDHVQGGVDDCEYHDEVTKEQVEELRDLCVDIVENCPLVLGKVKAGLHYENGNFVPIMQDGKVVCNPEYAHDRLPTTSGPFFGSEDYDEFYISDLKETIRICNEVLETTDFEKQMICYRSSW